MSGATVLTLWVGAIALGLGAVLSVVRRRHRARIAEARAAGTYVPMLDARGVWLFWNGPVTALLGLVLLLHGASRAHADIEQARIARELDAIVIACAPGAVEVVLHGEEPRRISMRARALNPQRAHLALALERSGELTLAPGRTQVLHAAVRSAGACGSEEPPVAAPQASGLEALLGGAWLEPGRPTRAWPECDGIVLDVRLRDDSGELARGERICRFAPAWVVP